MKLKDWLYIGHDPLCEIVFVLPSQLITEDGELVVLLHGEVLNLAYKISRFSKGFLPKVYQISEFH